MFTRVLTAAAAALALGCSTPKLHRQAADTQLIVESEVDQSHADNAFEVIQKVRPNFLHDRGETSLSKSRSAPYPTVYVDGQEFGPISSLRSIPASQISMIRLYHAWEAATLFGSNSGGAVIAITTRR
jgi:hypothetical protein